MIKFEDAGPAPKAAKTPKPKPAVPAADTPELEIETASDDKGKKPKAKFGKQKFRRG